MEYECLDLQGFTKSRLRAFEGWISVYKLWMENLTGNYISLDVLEKL